MKTAVEWLIEELKGVYESDYLNKLVQQAKEMEKEQMESAYLAGESKDKQYYNETFKNSEQ
jgi:hypothetical protein